MKAGITWLACLLCSAICHAELSFGGLQVIATHPHDPRIFTQGLALEGERLYQSSGLRGQSVVVAGPLRGLEVDASFHFAPRYFAEGLAVVGEQLLVLTWQAGELFVLDKAGLQLQGKRRYKGEGWGLAYDGESLWMSDGSSRIRRFDPQTMEHLGTIKVRDEDGAIRRINELEFVNGVLLANIWHSTRLVAIDPANGRVLAQWDLAPLVPEQRNYGRDSVANGIAYDPGTGHVWLTGKGWPILYEVKLEGLPRPGNPLD